MRLKKWKVPTLLGLIWAGNVAAVPAGAETYNVVMRSSYRYGNWGGGDYSNGKEGGNPRLCTANPVDDLDAAFMAHDQAYAQADDTYGERRITSMKKARGRKTDKAVRDVESGWVAAYDKADARLVDRIKALPELSDLRGGRDTWNGWKGSLQGKPSTEKRRTAASYAKWAASLGIFKSPPFSKYGG